MVLIIKLTIESLNYKLFLLNFSQEELRLRKLLLNGYISCSVINEY
jgi:hypothetical protein